MLQRIRAACEDLPAWRWYGMRVESIGEGSCRLSLQAQPGMINPDDNTVHGGVIAALIDEAVGTALRTVYELGTEIQGRTTTELSVSFLQGVLTSQVYAEARILRRGRTLVVGDAQVLDAEGKLCATGRVTYRVFGAQ